MEKFAEEIAKDNTMLDLVPQNKPLFTPQEIVVQSWTSLSMKTHKEKAMVFNAVSNPDFQIIDFVGQKISVEHIYAQAEQFTDTETGDIKDGTRVILFNPLGESFSCVSDGIKRSLTTLFATFGVPPFQPALIVIPALVKSKDNAMRKILKLNVAVD